jgi:hypothetical protein
VSGPRSNGQGEGEGCLNALIAVGGGLAVGVACMVVTVIVLGRVEIYGPPQVALGVMVGFVVGVFTGRWLIHRRRPSD